MTDAAYSSNFCFALPEHLDIGMRHRQSSQVADVLLTEVWQQGELALEVWSTSCHHVTAF